MTRKGASKKHHKNQRNWLKTDQLSRLVSYVGQAVVVVMLGLGGFRAYQWLTHPDTLPIRDVAVEGDLKHLDTGRLQDLIHAGITRGFFSIDLESLQQSIETLPWVYRVSVRRYWPDRISIEVEEQAPIAHWGEKGLLNRYGDVFVVNKNIEPLPVISGSEGREKMLIEAFLNNDRLLRTVGLGLIGLHEDARQDQRLILDNGIRLALGRRDQELRLRRFVTAYNHTLEGFVDRIEELDLRYTNGFSVGWKSEGSDLIGS